MVAKLRPVTNVTGAYLLCGEYDILVELECGNLSWLDAAIAATKRVEYVTRIMPLIAVKQC